MTIITKTDDYEKAFLEKHLKAIAKKKIDELVQTLETTTDSFKRMNIKSNIKEIENALACELKKLENPEKDEAATVTIGAKTSEIRKFVPEDFFHLKGFKIPRNLWEYLFDYQKKGVEWMLNLFEKQKGGILADDMGLGKTIQVCAFIVSLFASKKADNFLILCPVTVIKQWTSQLQELEPCPSIHKNVAIKNKGVTIMSYESFRSHNILPKFDCVFLDEGHKIKNKDSLIFQHVKKVETTNRFVITGTPIQNNLGELWTIFDFVNPSLLGTYPTFQEEFENKIKSNKSEGERQLSYQYSVMLRATIEPFLLRRMKNSLKNILPGKIDKVIFVTLSEKQTFLYINALEAKKFKLLAMNKFQSKGKLFSAISYLKKICNHPLLLENKSFDEFKPSSTEQQLNIEAYKTATESEMLEDSSKLKIVFELLDNWKSQGNRVLIFFQTIQMLEIARIAISKYRPDFKYSLMSGATPHSKRSELIDAFNEDPAYFLFLLTTRVGGLGLNLTGANRVIIYDPDWNPSTDNQAKERIYRYGQKSSVEIYRIICRETLEEKIYQKQIYKDCLSKKILSNPSLDFDRGYFSDIFSFHNSFKKDPEIKEDKNFTVINDGLVEVNEEDKKALSIMIDFNSKTFLSGEELIEFIKRREHSLNYY
ncbi:DNA excision repair protein ERCC-6 [Glugoides intestinalis]